MKAEKNVRSLWPTAIIGFFVLAVTFLVVFIAWASRQREDLVAENYYETEIKYQEQLDRLNRSQRFDSESIVTYDAGKRSIVVQLPNARGEEAKGEIHVYRPSDARLDREQALAVNGEGRQWVDAQEFAGGFWKVRVQWCVAGKEYFCDRPVIVP